MRPTNFPTKNSKENTIHKHFDKNCNLKSHVTLPKHRPNSRPAAIHLETPHTQTPATRPSPALPYFRLPACISSSHNKATHRTQDEHAPRGRAYQTEGTHTRGGTASETDRGHTETTEEGGGAQVFVCNSGARDCFHPT